MSRLFKIFNFLKNKKDSSDSANAWADVLLHPNVSDAFKLLVKEFFIPYRIDPTIYIINRDAVSIPYKHLVYGADSELSKDLFNFKKTRRKIFIQLDFLHAARSSNST